jgi:hypothetical protein
MKEPSQTSYYFESDECQFAMAKNSREAGKLVTGGFEYLCHNEGIKPLGSPSEDEHFRK